MHSDIIIQTGLAGLHGATVNDRGPLASDRFAYAGIFASTFLDGALLYLGSYGSISGPAVIRNRGSTTVSVSSKVQLSPGVAFEIIGATVSLQVFSGGH